MTQSSLQGHFKNSPTDDIGIGSENNGFEKIDTQENIYNILPANFQPKHFSLKKGT
jgi:hypothetical protein